MIHILKYFKELFGFSLSEENNNKFKISSLKFIFPYIKGHWKKGLSGTFLMLILSLLALPSPYLIKIIIDKVIVAKNIRLLSIIIIILFGIQLLRLLISLLTSYFFNIFSQEIIVKIKKALFFRLLRLPLSFFDNNQTGYILSRVQEVERTSLFFSSSLIRILTGLFEFIFCLVILFYLSWKLTLISFIILPLFYIATKYYSRRLKKYSRDTFEKEAILSRYIQDSLLGVEVIKYFTGEKRETEKINIHLDELKQTNIRTNIVLAFSTELLSLLGAIGGFFILWYSGLNIIKNSFTIGSYFAFSAYLTKLYGPTQILANINLMFQPAIIALNRVTELIDLTGEEATDNGIKINKLEGDIEFKNVSFSYDIKQILFDINIKINKKDKVIIVGPNGSGKSTIIKLILGLYKVQKGSIYIDSYNINEISLASLRERISIVSQNTFLFNDTIKNNILYSRPDAKKELIEEVARLSGAYEFIIKLPNKFDTEVGERGVKLSGGEKQKISIARAILKDSDLIIFDEANANLDQESELKINEVIYDKFKDKTSIIVAHNVQDQAQTNKIYFLKDGRIIDNNLNKFNVTF